MRFGQQASWITTALGALGLVALVGAIYFAVDFTAPRAAIAQEDPDAAGAAADPAAEPGAAPAPAKKKSEQTSMLAFYYEALGIWYTLSFLTMSFILVALIVMNFLGLQKNVVAPPPLIDMFEAHLNEKRYQEAYETAKVDDSYLGQVLAAGMSKLSGGYGKAVEAMQEIADDENMKMEHRASYVALIGSIAPMVGLYGTVDGMIAAFITIANSDTAPKPSELAKGISTALVTTIVGLFIAIPAIICYGYFRNQLARLGLEVGMIAGNLMGRFEQVDQKK